MPDCGLTGNGGDFTKLYPCFNPFFLKHESVSQNSLGVTKQFQGYYITIVNQLHSRMLSDPPLHRLQSNNEPTNAVMVLLIKIMNSPDPAHSKLISFLTLPAELRLQVYTIAFTNHQDRFVKIPTTNRALEPLKHATRNLLLKCSNHSRNGATYAPFQDFDWSLALGDRIDSEHINERNS